MADTIMVAVDGEPEHRAALDWAASRAARMQARLELIHVVERSLADSGEQSGRMLTLAGRALVAEEERYAVRRARAALHLEHADADPARAEEPQIRTRVVVGHAGRDLVAASAGAVLLVVGTPPAARTQRALAGSIAARVASAAACTVVAVPHGWRGHGHEVVVGVDGERPTDAAVDFAADEAARLGEPLAVVYAGYAVGAVRDGRRAAGPAAPNDMRERIVEASADRARRRHAGLVVRPRVVETSPSAGLVSEAHGARMLVLGTHDRRGVKRVMLGSVGHDVLLRARLPVVIARAATPSVSPSSGPEPA